MTDDDPFEILDYYGSSVPNGVGEAAFRYDVGSRRDTQTVAKLRTSNGKRLSNEWITFVRPSKDDGAVVRHSDEDGEWTYWAVKDDTITMTIARLVGETDFVIVDGDEEYLPDWDSEEDEVESEAGRKPWGWISEDSSINTIDTDTTTDGGVELPYDNDYKWGITDD